MSETSPVAAIFKRPRYPSYLTSYRQLPPEGADVVNTGCIVIPIFYFASEAFLRDVFFFFSAVP
ncbi:hypothetical protein, partial [Rhodobium orientis]|uniref:hypothetical protein n=1 Tax=Rhodobium orientis TaxID=34017 RepID=UPI001FE166B8